MDEGGWPAALVIDESGRTLRTNDHTYVNHMPAAVQRMIAESGKTLTVERVVIVEPTMDWKDYLVATVVAIVVLVLALSVWSR